MSKIRKLKQELASSEPFSGVKNITANLLLDNIWPAMLVDGKIYIFVTVQAMWSYEQFLELSHHLPVELRIKIERFYKMDWKEYSLKSDISISIDASAIKEEIDSIRKLVEQLMPSVT